MKWCRAWSQKAHIPPIELNRTPTRGWRTACVGLPEYCGERTHGSRYHGHRQQRLSLVSRSHDLNLASVNVKEEGSSFDLPDALARSRKRSDALTRDETPRQHSSIA
jgi:hypothetical protein